MPASIVPSTDTTANVGCFVADAGITYLILKSHGGGCFVADAGITYLILKSHGGWANLRTLHEGPSRCNWLPVQTTYKRNLCLHMLGLWLAAFRSMESPVAS